MTVAANTAMEAPCRRASLVLVAVAPLEVVEPPLWLVVLVPFSVRTAAGLPGMAAKIISRALKS